MKKMKFHYENIKVDDPDDVIIVGVMDSCEKAAEVAAAQFRPCILIDSPQKYHATKYEPLYLYTDKDNVLQECVKYCMSFS